MRKILIRNCLAVLALVILGGCIVQSIHPFYTGKNQIEMPRLPGEWDLVQSFGDSVGDKKIHPWAFTDGGKTNFNVESFSKEDVHANLVMVFFKVGDNTFADVLAGEVGDTPKLSEFWIWNIRPVHTVQKVELKDNTITFLPLNYDWLIKSIEGRQLSLPFIKPQSTEDEIPLFTATPAEWETFLKKYGANTNAFSTKAITMLKKRKINDKEEAKEAPKGKP